MATSNRRDVELVVKMRDEATASAKQISAALLELKGSQRALSGESSATASSSKVLIDALTTIEGLSNKVNSALSTATGSLGKQQGKYNAGAESLKALKEESNKALVSIVDLSLEMRKPGGEALASNLKNARREYAGLERDIAKLEVGLRNQGKANIDLALSLADIRIAATQVKSALAGVGDPAAMKQRLKLQAEEREASRKGYAQMADDQRRIDEAAIQLSAKKAAALSADQARLAKEEADRRETSRKGFAQLYADQRKLDESAVALSAKKAEEQRKLDESAAALASKKADELAAEQNQMAVAAARLKDTINPLAAIQARLNIELENARKLHKANKLSLDELTAAEKHFTAAAKNATDQLLKQQGGTGGGTGKPALFGLKPYELQNLGYQINDVFTQLASGTSVTQTLAQQGGQILQLLPNLAGKLVAIFTNPEALAFAGVIGIIAAGIARAANEAERLRNIEGYLVASADGALYSAGAINESAKSVRDFGVSIKDAEKIVQGFVSEGLNSERFAEFGKTAKDLSDVLGIDVVEASKKVTDAFTGGLAGIDKLNESTNFLTKTQREHIVTLFEQGKAAEAQTYAYDAFNKKIAAGAQEMRGPWSEAILASSISWQKLLDRLADTRPIQNALAWLNLLAKAAGGAAGATNQQRLADVNAKIAASQRALAAEKETFGYKMFGSDTGVRQVEADLKALRVERFNILTDIQIANDQAAGAIKLADTAAQANADARIKAADRIAEAAKSAAERSAAGISDLEAIRIAGETAAQKVLEDGGSQILANEKRRTAEALRRQQIEKENASAAKSAAAEAARGARAAASAAKLATFSAPVNGPVTSPYGTRTDPITGKRQFHAGIDYGVPIGTAVTARVAGRVQAADESALNGKFVKIDHGNGTVSTYLHLSSQNVKAGDIVNPGDLIGKSGNTGRSTGPHLDYRVTQNGTPVNPIGQIKVGAGTADAVGDAAKLQAQKDKAQAEFNLALDQENEKRLVSIRYLTEEQGLIGEKLLTVERARAVTEAVAKAEDDAAKKSLVITAEQIAKIRETTGAYFDLAHAKDAAAAQRDAAEKEVNDLTALRDALMQQADFYRNAGQLGLAGQLDARIATVNAQLREAAAAAIEYWQSIQGDPTKLANLNLTTKQVDAMILSLQTAGQATSNLRTQYLLAGKQINESLAGKGAEAFESFITKVTNGANVFKSFWQSLRQGVADFLRELAQAIIKQTIFNALMGKDAATGEGGVGGAVSGALFGLFGKSSSGKAKADTPVEVGKVNEDIVKKTASVGEQFNSSFADSLQIIAGGCTQIGSQFTFQFGNILSGILSGLGVGGGGSGGGGLFSKILKIGLTAAASYATGGGAKNIGGKKFHGGGHVGIGSGISSAQVPAAWFANAQRYHTGGIPGLGPNEVPIIADRTEEVITRGDSRHSFNGGRTAAARPQKVDVKVVNNIDSGELVSAGLGTRTGQQAFVNFIKDNQRLVRSVMGNN